MGALAIAAAALWSGAEAKSNMIATTGVSYCSDPLAIAVDTFDVRYFPDNSSIAFDISAASITRGLRLTANVTLNAYGMSAFQTEIDFCSILSGVICPLPTLNFQGSGVYTIPSNIVPDIPAIAYTVPDIEAVVDVNLIDDQSGVSAACLQVTLGNGQTVALPSVKWATAALFLAFFAFALVAGLFPAAPIGAGTMFYLLGEHLQHMAFSGTLSLNYPLVFRSWTSNFAWSLGLIRVRAFSEAIDSARAQTGGDGVTTSQDSDAFITRLYSPYNEPDPIQYSNSTSTAASLNRTSSTALIQRLAADSRPVDQSWSVDAATTGLIPSSISGSLGPSDPSYEVPVVTRNTTLLDPGMQAYVNRVGTPPENAYMTVFLWAILLFVVCAVVVALIAGAVYLVSRGVARRGDPDGHRRRDVWSRFTYWSSSTALRLTLFAYAPLTLFTFFQWTIGSSDSWLPVFISVIVWLGVTAALLWVGFAVWVHARRHGVDEGLRRDAWGRGRRWEPVFEDFKPGKWWAMGPALLLIVLKLAFLGLGQGHGELQAIALIVLEALTLILLLGFRPYRLKKHTFLASVLSILHLIVYGICVAFVYSEGVKPIPRAVLGFVCLAVQSIGILLIFFFALWTLLFFIIWCFRHPMPLATPDVNRTEKGYFPPVATGRRWGFGSKARDGGEMTEKDGPQPVSNLDLGEPRPLGGGPAEDARSSVTLADEGQSSVAQAGNKHLDRSDGQPAAYGYRPQDERHQSDDEEGHVYRQSSADGYYTPPAGSRPHF